MDNEKDNWEDLIIMFQNIKINATLDWHLMMIVSGPKKALEKILSMLMVGKCRPRR